MLSALILAATVQAAAPSAGLAESIKLCSQKAACSFVVHYPEERLVFAEPVGPKPPPRSGFLCHGGWVNHAHTGSSGAEILIQSADSAWAKHWAPLATSQCHRFHQVMNIRLRALDGQSSWQAIFLRADH